MNKPVCPNCGWGSRVKYLRREKKMFCEHCSYKGKKEQFYGKKTVNQITIETRSIIEDIKRIDSKNLDNT
ncbi:unnamed protein product [marine sediment metagenome]|uniref:Uncharacterized protein n=1 Tax=marine sediment metagenome TaxID=412755 RepID=X1M5N6_9ZZZZ